jgi:hypothetical protein
MANQIGRMGSGGSIGRKIGHTGGQTSGGLIGRHTPVPGGVGVPDVDPRATVLTTPPGFAWARDRDDTQTHLVALVQGTMACQSACGQYSYSRVLAPVPATAGWCIPCVLEARRQSRIIRP